MRTLKDISESDCNLRVWCYECQHVAELETEMIGERYGYNATIDRLRARFKCSKCRSKDVLVVPASRPKLSWVGVFHAMRSARKRRR